MSFKGYLNMRRAQAPILTYFDYLYSEYLSMKERVTDEEARKFIEELQNKKKDLSLSWNDLYYFELVLAKFQAVETLRPKIMSLRSDYRSVAGQKEYDDYMAAKPPDLMNPPDPTDPPDASKEEYERLLREDLKDLLGRLYLRYAILPIREARLKGLTWYAAGLCLFSLIVLLFIVAFQFVRGQGGNIFNLKWFGTGDISSLTIFAVVATGAMGGFVSALQRIQSPPTEGDTLYNLSLLFYGSYSVFIAPITGAIFAILLYLMFTSQILTGSFFPTIYTPPPALQAAPQAAAEASPSPTPSPSPSPEQTGGTNTNAGKPGKSASPTPSPTATPKPVPKQSLTVMEFLAKSGPAGGSDYALLIIWCFIAGFAERFVPDALDRLISRNEANNRGSS